MGNIIPIEDVNKFLVRIKQAIANGKYRFEGKRRKNVESLALAGILPKHVKGYIMALTYLDYFNGPEPERGSKFPPGQYLFFGCIINGWEFFIKVKVEDHTGDDFCVCISFHIAASPIYYPYR